MGKAFQRRHTSTRARLATVAQDGSRKPSRSPRRGSTSWLGPLLVPIEIRPDVGALGAASPTNQFPFKVGQPDMTGPAVAADRGPMAAFVVGAIDQEAANARCSHFREGDFLLAALFVIAAAGESGHAPLKRNPRRQANRPIGLCNDPIEPELCM
jgi:hypothetical protein